jgi:hypothetical protein
MKRFRGIFASFVAAIFIVLPISASADTLSQTVIVTVRATVQPARYIIVDNHGTIQSIISNTSEDVTPTVYLGSIKQENAVPLSPQTLESYRQIVEGLHATGPGVLYRRPPATTASAHKPQTNILGLIQKRHA